MFLNKWILIILVFGLISTPLVGVVFNFGSTSDADFRKTENRNPYKYPTFPTSIKDFKEFFSAFESAFNDHLRFRSFLIRLFCEINVKLLDVSPNEKLLIGKAGHYFNASCGNGYNDLIYKAIIIDKQTIIRESNYLIEKEYFLRDLKIPVLLLAIPTRPLFEFQNLPSFIQKQIDPSFLETPPALRIIKNMPKEFSEKYLLFPYRKALEANNAYPLFPEKNFHWQASRYTKLVANCIAEKFGLAPYKEPGFDDFRKEQTISDLSGLAGTTLVNKNVFVYKKNIWSDLKIQEKNFYGVYKNYPHFFPFGNYTVNPSQKGKLLLVGDSFAPILRFDLARYFGEVISINFNQIAKRSDVKAWFKCVFKDIQPNYIVFCSRDEFKIPEEFIDNFYLVKSN